MAQNLNNADYLIKSNFYTDSESVPMSMATVKEMWYGLLNDPSISNHLRLLIENVYIPYNLCPEKLSINTELFKIKDSIFDTIIQLMDIMDNSSYKYISPSLKYFVDSPLEITRGYPNWFYIAFPDVAYWVIKEDGYNQSFSMFEHLTEDEFVENGKIKWIHLKKIVDLYLSSTLNMLECRVYP